MQLLLYYIAVDSRATFASFPRTSALAGDKHAADDAAVEAMRNVFDSIAFDGVVVIGEGEKDEASLLTSLSSWSYGT